MSEYTFAAIEAIPARIMPTANRMQVLVATIQRISQSLKTQAATVEELRSSQAMGETVVRLTALAQCLATPEFSELRERTVSQLSPSTKCTLQQLASVSQLAAAHHTLFTGIRPAVLEELVKATRIAHGQLAAEERMQTLSDVSSVLAERGYRVNQISPSRTDQSCIRASLGERAAVARISDRGHLELDLAGFEPGACTTAREQLFADLGKRGYGFRESQRVTHNRREGGQLVSEVTGTPQAERDPLDHWLRQARKAQMRAKR